MIKSIVAILLFNSFLSIGQNFISYGSLKIDKERIGYYQKEKFTGFAILKNDEIKTIYPYKEGKLNGEVKTKNEIINYENNFIKDYIFYNYAGDIIFKKYNIDAKNKITSVRLLISINGIPCVNKINSKDLLDTISDVVKLGFVIVLLSNQEIKEIIPCNDVNLIDGYFSYSLNGIFGDNRINSLFIERKYFKHPISVQFYKLKCSTKDGVLFDYPSQQFKVR